MKFLILGNGFIGNILKDKISSILHCNKISSITDVKRVIDSNDCDIVINCIGKTGTPNIDWCEINKAETYFANVTIPALIQEACLSRNKKMIHISSGCLFNGGPFSETDKPNFVESYYSKTKVMAEELLEDVLQLRIRMPIASFPHKRSFLTKILSYDKLISVLNSVTIIDDFVDVLIKLSEMNQTGIFNVVNPCPVTHSEIVEFYNNYSDIKHNPQIISTDDLSNMTTAPRSNCVLSIEKLDSLGIRIPNTLNSLNRIIPLYVAIKEENLCKV